MTESQKKFADEIAKYVKELGPKYGIAVVSPIVAQAVLESGWGTSNKAKFNNFFGLKYRENRLTCHSGTFVDGSSEQNPDGTYVSITDQWYKFASVKDGVEGYLQFINTSRYSNLKGVTDWKEYIKLIREDGYATSLSYVQNLTNVIKNNDLTIYDIEEKEENKMNIISSIMTNNPCYKSGKKITVKGLMIHSVGCPQPSAQVFIKNWNRSDYNRACVHAFIDANTGNIYQTLPWNHRGWHGGGSSNNTHIGVEMCEPDCIKYTGGSSFTCSDKEKAIEMVKKTYNSAVSLFAYLCEEYNLNPLTDICSHKEGHKKGIASNHGDPEHLWSQLGTGYTMDGFRKDVQNKMGKVQKEEVKEEQKEEKPAETTKYYRVRKSWNDTKSQLGAYTNLENAKKACKDGYCVFDWNGNQVWPEPKKEEPKKETNVVNTYLPGMYRVTCDSLNIRKGPGINHAVVGCIKDKGTYTIVEVKNTSWGKLKSGSGWINIHKNYCTKVNSTSSTTTSKPVVTAKKSNKEIAKEVIAGKWGNGTQRKAKLEAAGYNYTTIQNIVNKLCK
jgi:N-acetyl-anhydromuramyl-L-alanine amidase AmpD